jgi:hypothetical protein
MYSSRQIISAALTAFPQSENTKNILREGTPVTVELLESTFLQSVGEAINLALYAADQTTIQDFMTKRNVAHKPRETTGDPTSEEVGILMNVWKYKMSAGIFSFIDISKKHLMGIFHACYEGDRDEKVASLLIANISAYEKSNSQRYGVAAWGFEGLSGDEGLKMVSEIVQYSAIHKLLEMAIISHAHESLLADTGIDNALQAWRAGALASRYYKNKEFGINNKDSTVIENYIVDNYERLSDGNGLLHGVSLNLTNSGSHSRFIEVAERAINSIDEFKSDSDSLPKSLALYLQAAKAGLNEDPEIRNRALEVMDTYFDKFLTSEESISQLNLLSQNGEYSPEEWQGFTLFIDRPEFENATPKMLYEVLRRINKICPDCEEKRRDVTGVLNFQSIDKVAVKALSYYLSENPGSLKVVRESIVNPWQENIVNLVSATPTKERHLKLVESGPSI